MASQLAINPKFNGLPLPFPLKVSKNVEGLYFVGHHSETTFGSIPYLLVTKQHGWILIDTPRFSSPAIQAIESLTGPVGPGFMVLTHVDDTAGHDEWKEHFPCMKRIFHSGDLGVNNWRGDTTLDDVEIILRGAPSTREKLQFYDLDGNNLSNLEGQDEVVLIHTPGHSPGSICLWKRPTGTTATPSGTAEDCSQQQQPPPQVAGVLLSGDTYAWTTTGTSTSGGRMTSFPRYGDDRKLQSEILVQLAELQWDLVAPGHGHVRQYFESEGGVSSSSTKDTRLMDMQPAIDELEAWEQRTVRR